MILSTSNHRSGVALGWATGTHPACHTERLRELQVGMKDRG
jgi:hypothetical protein